MPPEDGQRVLVIYSAATGRVRRVISADDKPGDDLRRLFPARAGEAALVLPWDGVDGIQASVLAATGASAPEDRYVAVGADGVVTQVLRCDPGCGDAIQGRELFPHASARRGYRRMPDGSFQRAPRQIEKELARERAARADLEATPPDGVAAGELADARADADIRIVALGVELAQRRAPL